LILIGAVLVIGVWDRVAAIGGTILLSFYYFAYPPFQLLSDYKPGIEPAFIVNSNLIEILVLVLLIAVPTGRVFGLSGLVSERKVEKEEQQVSSTRRQMLKSLGTLPILGVFGIPFLQRGFSEKVNAVTGASSMVLRDDYRQEYLRLKNLDLDNDSQTRVFREEMPYGMIGDLKISRMISGSNLISMNMHARDLDYVNDLARHYNTEDRVMMTMKKMESQGVNAIVLKDHNFKHLKNLKRYWTDWGGKMKWIADPITRDFNKFERLLIDHLELGASAAYIWGGSSDIWFDEGKPDNIAKALEIIKSYKVPAGIGAHRNEPVAFALQENLQPDFIFKTFHQGSYWSAHPRENYEYMEMFQEMSPDHGMYHDNLWCQHPEVLAEMIKESDIPFIAFKVMAAGAIPPKEGFDYAFQNGADFLCVGMFDFQVDDDIKLFKQSYRDARNRQRPWIG
jgi:hypothetical protein